MLSHIFNKHCMQKQIRKNNNTETSTNINTAQNKPKRSTHKPSSSMHHPLQVPLATNLPSNTPPKTDNDPRPHQSHEESSKCLGCYWFLFCYPEGSSNLRTACSETLMLRERKASMAERSLSSLTGELLLLATAAAAFATFAARKLSGEECPWQRARGIGPKME